MKLTKKTKVAITQKYSDKIFLLVLICISFACQSLLAGAPGNSDNWYLISEIQLQYKYKGQANLPEIEDICRHHITLNQIENGYTSDGSDNSIEFSIVDLPSLAMHSFHLSALKSIQDQLVQYMNSCGIGGVVILPAPGQLDYKKLTDLRSGADKTPLPLIIDIWVAQVVDLSISSNGEVTTDRSASESRIINNSPIKPDSIEFTDPNDVANESTDLIMSEKLDDYLHLLNRHPGRRVDASISPSGQPGEIALEYNVRQSKPWLAYAQLSNTGSKDTNDFRQRFGYVNNQMTGNDDIFNIDYLTTDYSDVHSVAISYDRPWFDSQLTRIRVYGNYSEYVSSEIGVSEVYLSGKESTGGFELTSNVYQKGRLFIDQFAGLRFSNYENNNYVTNNFDNAKLIVPSFGYRLEYDSGIRRTFGQVGFETNIADNSDDFGRNSPQANWWKINWNLNHSFYLEPIWDPVGWRDIKTPKNSTLAHEIALSARGQYTRSRLIPQEKMSIGGMYSVRGYRQSFVSGDNVMILSGEYRYHIPRAFDLAKPVKLPLFGSQFRWAPEQVYGFPDWDLIFKTFLDGGFANHVDMTQNEDNYGLLSGGIGLELQLNRYFSVRCDYGVVIENVEANGEQAKSGDSRIHISGMIAY